MLACSKKECGWNSISAGPVRNGGSTRMHDNGQNVRTSLDGVPCATLDEERFGFWVRATACCQLLEMLE
jgi:hypothetical protein